MTAVTGSSRRSFSPAPVLLVEAHRGQGGPPTTVRDLAPELSARREVVVAIPDGAVKRHLDALGPPLSTTTLPWSGTRLRDRISAQPVLATAIRRLGPRTAVHANGKSALNLVAPVARSMRFRPTIFVHFHDFELDARSVRTIRLWERLGIRMVFAPVSEQSAGQLGAHGLGHLVDGLLANPIRCPPDPVPGAPAASDHAFRIASVVSRQPRKGLDVVIAVAHLLRHSNAVIDIFGVGEDTPNSPFIDRCLERRETLGLTREIRLRGRVPDLAANLVGYDCLLVASRRESFCRVAVEGMVAGVPVVASRIEGLVEAVGERNCVLYEREDVAGAAKALRRVMDDRALGQHLKARGAAWVRRFSPDRVCDELEVMYRRHL